VLGPNSDFFQREQLLAKNAIRKERETKKLRKEKEEEELRQLVRDEKIDELTEDELVSPNLQCPLVFRFFSSSSYPRQKKVEELKAQGLGINLASFTGKPVPEDILLYAMPICAPYDVLRDYKFKVKVLPGGGKKGQGTSERLVSVLDLQESTSSTVLNVFIELTGFVGVKTALHIFFANQDMTPREKDLIKAIPEEDLIQAMITNPKVSAPGLTQVRRK
jgi:hypothetical protein